MEELSTIARLLGEENEQKIKDGITNIILNYVQDDIESLSVYLLDWEEMFEEIKNEIKAEIKEKVKKKYIEGMSQKIDKFLKE